MSPDRTLGPFIETRCDPLHSHIRAYQSVERGIDPFNSLREGRAGSGCYPESEPLYMASIHSKIVYPPRPRSLRHSRPAWRRRKPSAKNKATRAKKTPAAASDASVPRAGSKTSQVIAMLKRKCGTTLEEIMSAMGWQKHTTRAMLSAGGSLTKKHGLVVTGEKVGDQRKYSVKACRPRPNRFKGTNLFNGRHPQM
jgi:hypothetical protein